MAYQKFSSLLLVFIRCRDAYTHHATKEDPQYVIQSDKTDHVAVHKGKALTELSK